MDETRAALGKRDVWDRYGWVMACVWLIFLIFPISEVVASPRSVPVRALGMIAIAAFAATYIRVFVLIGRADTGPQCRSIGLRYGAAMVGWCLVIAAAIGPAALGLMPFIVSVAMFSLRLREAIAVAAGCAVLAVVIPALLDDLASAIVYLPVVVSVAIATGTIRILEHRSFQERKHKDEVALMVERDRVARDVHDVLGHSLTVVTVKAELAERLVDVDPVRAKEELAEIQNLTRQALTEIRATVAGLRVVRLDDELAGAATALAGAGITANLPRDSNSVDPRHRLILAWALRESITNVVRHSRANACSVELGRNWLAVADDGVGAFHQPEGGGLRGLRERVGAVGGIVELGPARSATDAPGTRITVTL